MKKIPAKILVATGILLCLDATILLTAVNGSVNFPTSIAGLFLLLFGFFYDKIDKRLKIAFLTFIAIYASTILFIAVKTSDDTADFDENYVIVLGAGIKDEKVLKSLQKRLDKCLEYATRNPEAIIIVSGGQGRGESISEAEAMKRYLIDCGVNGAKILKEDKSTNTNENFRFSKQIIDELSTEKEKARIVFITNSYHSYRAKLIARGQGIETTVLNAPLPIYLRPSSYIRETLAVFKFFVFR